MQAHSAGQHAVDPRLGVVEPSARDPGEPNASGRRSSGAHAPPRPRPMPAVDPHGAVAVDEQVGDGRVGGDPWPAAPGPTSCSTSPSRRRRGPRTPRVAVCSATRRDDLGRRWGAGSDRAFDRRAERFGSSAPASRGDRSVVDGLHHASAQRRTASDDPGNSPRSASRGTCASSGGGAGGRCRGGPRRRRRRPAPRALRRDEAQVGRARGRSVPLLRAPSRRRPGDRGQASASARPGCSARRARRHERAAGSTPARRAG